MFATRSRVFRVKESFRPSKRVLRGSFKSLEVLMVIILGPNMVDKKCIFSGKNGKCLFFGQTLTLT